MPLPAKASCTALAVATWLFGTMGLSLLPAAAEAQSNPTVLENQQPGTDAWAISGSTANDSTGQIKGYASAASVNKGETITFYVSVNPAQTYTIDVYRLGWYQGLGGRLMQHIGTLNGVKQTTCPVNAVTGLIECGWTPSYTLTTQTSWTSGIYLARLKNAQNFENYIIFVVRDDSRAAALLYQQPVTTYQAYNNYPNDGQTGKSLYAFNSFGATTVTGEKSAAKVSFDRPYLDDGSGQDFFKEELNFVRWLEKSGYDVTYSTNIETHSAGTRLLNYRGFLSVGHDEYWSKEMYDAAVAARDAGVNLGFFGADAVYWAIRFEPSTSGVPNRVVVCYRDTVIDPVTDPSLKTVLWRDAPLNRPEQTLVGVQYTSIVPWTNAAIEWAPYVVTNSSHWVYAGTGFRDGDKVLGIVGYEADRLFSEHPAPTAVPGTFTLLSQSPFSGDYANSSIYQAPSGAWVFGAGTIFWSWGLDTWGSGWNIADSRLQRTTANILDRFVANAQPDFTISAAPSSQTVAPGGSTSYTVTINPTGGFTGLVAFSVSGLPADSAATFVPNPGTSSSTMSVTTASGTPSGPSTVTISASSGSLTRTTTVSLNVSNVSADFTLAASPTSRTVTQGGSATYAVTITPSGGFSGQVSLSVGGLPTGAGGTFAPNPTTGSSTLSLTTNMNTPGGAHTLTITGTSGSLVHTATVTLVVNAAPDFTLAVSPTSQTVNRGGSTSYGVTITPSGGFTGMVNLSVTGLPPGAGGSFAPNPATGSSTLSVTADASTAGGTYPLTITGVSGNLTRTVTVTLVVTAPDFALSASPVSRTVTPGAATTFNFTITATGGFAGQVSLSVSGLPSGASGSFAPNPASSSSTLTVTTSATTPTGTSSVTVTGVSGAITRTSTVSLTVARAGVTYDNAVRSGFKFGVTTITTPTFTIGTGANRAAMIMVAMNSNTATNITATLGGMPATMIPGTDTGTAAPLRTLIFRVVNPPSGPQRATVSWVGSVTADVGVITVSGADQATPTTNGTFFATVSNPGKTAAVTVASSGGDLTATVALTSNAWVNPFTSQIKKWGVDSKIAGGDVGPGTGTTTHVWTEQYLFQAQAVSGANFKAAAAQ